ncbi:MAG: hypothetical protein R3F42_04910 [Pseudomonadota bacterium]
MVSLENQFNGDNCFRLPKNDFSCAGATATGAVAVLPAVTPGSAAATLVTLPDPVSACITAGNALPAVAGNGLVAGAGTATAPTAPVATAARPLAEAIGGLVFEFACRTEGALPGVTGAGADTVDFSDRAPCFLPPNQLAGESLLKKPLTLSRRPPVAGGAFSMAGAATCATAAGGMAGTAALLDNARVTADFRSSEETVVTCAPGKRSASDRAAARASALVLKNPSRSCCHSWPSLLKVVV